MGNTNHGAGGATAFELACEYWFDNEEPDWGTAILEPFVIFPTGSNLI